MYWQAGWWILLATALWSCEPHLTSAQIPRLCVENVTLATFQCCPAAPQNGLTCGGPERGSCEGLIIFEEPVDPEFQVDDRVNWPRRFFHRMCQCRGNYFGVACEECKFGWTGKDCMEKQLLVRRNIHSFSAAEKAFFRQLVARSDEVPSEYMLLLEKDLKHSDPLFQPTFIPTTVHKYFVAMHRYASRATLFKDPKQCAEKGHLDYNHGVAMFSLWHRYFMLIWERELRKIAAREFGVNNFAIPYWDWIDATECEVCTDELVGGPGPILPKRGIQLLSEKSPFHKWVEYCQPPQKARSQCFGCHFSKTFEPLNRHWNAKKFPDSKQLDYVLKKKPFFVEKEGNDQCLSFHKAFEGFCGEKLDDDYLWMHNRVHNMVTGSFCCAATAANDPLFILHHSQVDRIVHAWYSLQKPNPETDLPMKYVKPGQFRDSNMVGFIPVVRNRDMLVDIASLGFTYDNYEFGKRGLKVDA